MLYWTKVKKGRTKKELLRSHWLSLGILLILALSLGSYLYQGKAKAEATPQLIVSLADEQPSIVIQSQDELVARFDLYNATEGAAQISSLHFYPRGNMQRSLRRFPGLLPLTVKAGGETLGRGDKWIFGFGQVYQEVQLGSPLQLGPQERLTLDIYTDLSGRRGSTFGLDLTGVGVEPALNMDLPVSGRLYSIKRQR